ncbi:MAG: hypothetical protein Q9215_000514 [Flavoplaca cf. flavocitrina]
MASNGTNGAQNIMLTVYPRKPALRPTIPDEHELDDDKADIEAQWKLQDKAAAGQENGRAYKLYNTAREDVRGSTKRKSEE